MGQSKSKRRKVALLLLGIMVLVMGSVPPEPEGLSHGGKMTLVLLVFLFIMWTFHVMPNWVSAVAGIIMLPFMGAAESLAEIYAGFVNSTFFFLLAVFGIAAMVHKSDLPSKLMHFFVYRFGNDSKKLVFAFGMTTWVLSGFMSDLASCAIVAGVAAALTKDFDLPPSFKKCLMIIIPLASMSGGISMPISSATNATIIQKLEITTGEQISFLQWTAAGLPIALLAFLTLLGLVLLVLKPENLSDATLEALHGRFENDMEFSFYDKKVLAIIACMLALWISGSWIKVFDTTFVALIGLVVMFLPGVDMLTWEDYRDETPFDLILLVGALFSLTTAMVNTGAIDWIMQVTLGGFGSWNAVLFYIVMSVVLVLIRGALPGGPLLVAMVTPSVIAMGAAFDMSTMLLVVTLSIWGQLSALVPFVDGQWLMTYNYGYFNTRDLLKVGVPWSVAFVLIMALALPPLGEFAHLFAV